MAPFRRAVLMVALLNLAYGVFEFAMGRVIGSVSLTADSIDFVEDGALNLLIFWAAVWSLRRRANVGHVLAVLIVFPTLVTLVAAILKVADPDRPASLPLTVTALGALAVNLACAGILARHRHGQGSLAKAAWLSARNDAFANLAILAAAAVALAWVSGWPDIAVGVGIAVLNADAAVKVWRAASRERSSAAEPDVAEARA